jgi:membrane-bound lytic murein transglycosylase A
MTIREEAGVKGRRLVGRRLLLASLVICLAACAPRVPTKEIQPEQALEQVTFDRPRLGLDDMDRASLEQAVRESLRYYQRLPAETRFRCGPDTVSLDRMKRSLEAFLALLAKSNSWEELGQGVRQRFVVYQAAGKGPEHRVLFTGYYEAVIQGSLTQDEHYRFPVYGVPGDMVTIDLEKFRSQYQGVRLVGRIQGNQVVPYYSREEIDGKGALAGKGLELAWVADPVALSFMQIQGSGRIRLVNGESIRLSYAASNGRPYRSIGGVLVERGLVPREEMSMQAIRRYLADHPEEMSEILDLNPSYVFFRKVTEGPLGSLSVPVTPGRSIATDLTLFPRGALAFIECQKPIFARDGVITGWEPFGRYVVNQDTGGAIKGPARVDLFWGSGPLNQIAAGHLRNEGSLFFLVLKEE